MLISVFNTDNISTVQLQCLEFRMFSLVVMDIYAEGSSVLGGLFTFHIYDTLLCLGFSSARFIITSKNNCI